LAASSPGEYFIYSLHNSCVVHVQLAYER
jgi:hypothetical protein